MRRKAILLAVMGIVLVGTGVSLAAVLVSDPVGSAGAGSYLEKNSGPAEVRSFSPGGSDNEVQSSAYRLAARPEKLPEEGASYGITLRGPLFIQPQKWDSRKFFTWRRASTHTCGIITIGGLLVQV